MPQNSDAQNLGRVFNDVAVEYDRHRPTYPTELIDHACNVARLGAGDEVLEIGCGTGQLTRALLARGLIVTAVEPGAELIARARERLHGLDEVKFINARFEDAELPPQQYRAVFAATSIHWIDPDVTWWKIADALSDGGSVTLLSYFGLDDPYSAGDEEEFRTALVKIAPEIGAEWQPYRTLDSMLAGAQSRRGNISELWSWLGDYALARPYVADLFAEAEIVALPAHLEHTATELNNLLGTMSFWSRLSLPQREALAAENAALYQRLGRKIRSGTVACLVTARRRSDGRP